MDTLVFHYPSHRFQSYTYVALIFIHCVQVKEFSYFKVHKESSVLMLQSQSVYTPSYCEFCRITVNPELLSGCRAYQSSMCGFKFTYESCQYHSQVTTAFKYVLQLLYGSPCRTTAYLVLFKICLIVDLNIFFHEWVTLVLYL